MDIIKSSVEISNLFSQGKRLNTPYFTLIVLLQNDRMNHSCGRVAFIAGKKLGNAVWRNSAKRRMREICRQIGGPWKGYDVVFLAKRNVIKAPYATVKAAAEEISLNIPQYKNNLKVE